jgi:hypothetical protein
MMESMHQDPSSHPGISHFASNAPSFRIKRPGARPLVFEGIELAMAMSFSLSLPYWYEVNLYRTTDQRFVATIKLFYRAENEQDMVKAWEFDSLEQALDKLASYDAGQDVRVTLDPSDLSASAAELAACAMELRAKIMAARRHFESLVGEFFYELDVPKAPPARPRL